MSALLYALAGAVCAVPLTFAVTVLVLLWLPLDRVDEEGL